MRCCLVIHSRREASPARLFVPRRMREFTSQPEPVNLGLVEPRGYRPPAPAAFVLLILAVNRYFESKGQSSNRSLQCFHVLHSSTWPARMRSRDQSVLQVTLYAQASET